MMLGLMLIVAGAQLQSLPLLLAGIWAIIGELK